MNGKMYTGSGVPGEGSGATWSRRLVWPPRPKETSIPGGGQSVKFF